MSELAYLVIREGAKWTDVFRLTPGQTVTIGRSPTNQIIIKDERCSRNHAELFLADDQWTLRDLDSRNGTVLGSEIDTANDFREELAVEVGEEEADRLGLPRAQASPDRIRRILQLVGRGQHAPSRRLIDGPAGVEHPRDCGR